MTFTSLEFMFFCPAVYLVFRLTADRWRWLVLLAASYGFYAALGAPYLLAVLLLVTGISYLAGIKISRASVDSSRKLWLRIGIAGCLGIMVLMKYLPNVARNGADRDLIINIGVSYFSFQAVSYLADVYLELEEPELHWGHYALYLAFFPKLLQGPIERAGDLLPQLKRTFSFDHDALRSGMLLFGWGLFQKLVLADRFALIANEVYDNLPSYTGVPLIVATYAYAFQLFFDFSAYSDMARGAGRIFGVELSRNFNSPYLATSVADFWRRWHISFSRCILDYLFKPLQMSWRSFGRYGTASAALVAFLISGVWHGATWGFVLWGGVHGFYLASSTLYQPVQKKLQRWLGLEKSKLLTFWKMAVTFNLVCLGWIFFRASSLDDAIYVLRNLFVFKGFRGEGITDFLKEHVLIGIDRYDFLILLAMLSVTAFVHFIRGREFSREPVWVRWPLMYMLVSAVVFLGKYQQSSFIYFKF